MKKSSLTGMFFLLVLFVSFLNASTFENIHSENDIYGFQNNYEYAEWQKPDRDSLNMRVIGRTLFGPCRQVFVKDTIAYTFFGNTLIIFSTADKTNPIILGVYDEFGRSTFYVKDSLAYMSGSDFTVFNISDPSSVHEIGSCKGGGSFSVVDTLVYIMKSKGFNVINISDPAHPCVVACDTNLCTDIARGIKVKDSIAYLLVGCLNLDIVDVSDPLNPQIITTLGLSGNVYAWYLQDSLLYLSGYNIFAIYDVSDPTSPQLLNNIGPLECQSILVTDTLLFTTSLSDDDIYYLEIYNASDPSSLELISQNTIGKGRTGGICVEDNFAYLAKWEGGFEILDVSDPFNIDELGCYDNAGYTKSSIDVCDGIVYLPSLIPLEDGHPPKPGLYTLNAVEPSSPSIMGYSRNIIDRTPRNVAVDIEVVGDYAYLAEQSFEAEFSVYDITNPSYPYFYSEHLHSQLGGIWGIEVEDTIAYVAHECGPGSRSLDISDPASPVVIGLFPPSPHIDIEVVDTLAYLIDVYHQLMICNVADPANPELLSTLMLTQVTGLFVQDSFVYVTSYGGGVTVVNASDPTSPVVTGHWEKAGFDATNLCIMNNIAFVGSMSRYYGDGSRGIWVLDVSDPTSPVEVGYYGGISPCRVTTDGTYIYAVGWGTGLWILEYYGPVSGPVTVSLPAIYASPEDSIKIPVTLSSVTEKDITSSQFTITYDNNIVTLTDVALDSTTIVYGTDWNMNWDTTGGTLTVNMSGSDTLTGVGPLVQIDFFVEPDVYQETTICPLHFDNFIFNSGQPNVVTNDGKIIVIIPATITVAPDSLYFYDGDDVFNHSFCTTPTFHITGNTDGFDLAEISKSTSPLLPGREVQISIIENEHVSSVSPILNKYEYIDKGITDTLRYDNNWFDTGIGLHGDYLPDSTETYGLATYFVLSEFGLSPGDTLGGIMLYFGPFNGTDYRLYIWENASGELRPASELEPIFVDMNVPSPIKPSWSWTTVYLAAEEIVLPDTFWVSVCYNRITSPDADWYLGYNSLFPDIHTYGNLGGTCNDWLQFSNFFGVRVIMGNLRYPQTAELCIKNEGSFPLNVNNITHTSDWVISVFPTNFTRIFSGDSAFINVFVNATGLDNGVYYDTLHILSNDPSIPDYQVPIVFNVDLLGVEEIFTDKPIVFGLGQIYPNPAISDVNIQYSVANNTMVSLNIYDLSGRLIRTLVNGYHESGYYNTIWDRKDLSGNSVSSGIYFYCLNADNYIKMNKIVLVR